ncbi:MAG TPA: nuclear transport factor 2 family protein [Candidatus Acidoferrales bacterium]|nr:nuclear transport factor 2 family protein [Candidatus Acidoferrales bacterium]
MNGRAARVRTFGFAAVAILSLTLISGAWGQTKSGDSLAARLRAVEDRQEIEQLLTGDYPRALDATDWKAYAALFAKDGTLIMGGGATKRTGPAAIEEYFKTLRLPAQPASATPSPCPAKPGSPRFEHVVTNLSVKIDGDMATDEAYWQTILTRDCKSVVAGAGHYEDTLKREDGRWRFYKREIFDDFPPRMAPAAAPAAPAAPKP